MNNQVRNVVLWFPFFPKILVAKDPGQIAERLAKMGYTVRLLTYSDDRHAKVSTIGKVELVSLSAGSKLSRRIGLALYNYVLRNGKTIDCMILYFGFSQAIASVLFRLVNRQGVCIVKMDSDGNLYKRQALRIVKLDSTGDLYGGEIYKLNLARMILIRLFGEVTFRILALTADLLIIESPEAREKVLEKHPYLKHRLKVLPNGIDQNRFGELSQGIRAQRQNKILYVGRIEYPKGIDLLIKAFYRLKDKYPDWKIELVGTVTPSFDSELEKLITDDIKDRIISSGYLYGTELVQRYIEAKIFCFPSRVESFGFVMTEAMYFSNAVVSSNVGAARYILDDGNAGMIFDNENVEQLTTCLDRLMSDEQLRARLATAAKSRCEKLFNWDSIIKELDRHIGDVFSKKRTHSLATRKE